MAIPSPNVETTRRPDRVHSIASLSATGALDLTAVSDKGNFAPQVVRINNASASVATIVLTPEYGANFTVVVNAGAEYRLLQAVKALVSCDQATVSALFFWWAGNSGAFNR